MPQRWFSAWRKGFGQQTAAWILTVEPCQISRRKLLCPYPSPVRSLLARTWGNLAHADSATRLENHRLTVPHNADDDYYESHPMENRAHRTPSPAHPLQHGYHLEDNPYSQSQLDIPQGPGRYSPGDSLQMQTAVSKPVMAGRCCEVKLTDPPAISRQPGELLHQPRGASRCLLQPAVRTYSRTRVRPDALLRRRQAADVDAH